MENLIYLAKVNLYLVMFYVCFYLLFRRHTFFTINRCYLLITLLVALLLPAITIPEAAPEKIPPVVYNISLGIDGQVLQRETPVESQKTDWLMIISLIYMTGVVFMSVSVIRGFAYLFRIIRKGEAIKFEDHTLVILPREVSEKIKMGSFSFFKWLVICQDDYENCLENVIRHEMVHIRQKHSVDIIIIELLKIVFWFNPVLWFYKISMQEIHEFLADASASDREDYATFLISYSFNAPVQSLSNPFFNSSLLKSRIKMIFQNRTPNWFLGKYMMVLPVLGLVIILTAAREQLIRISDLGTKLIEKNSPEYVRKTENQGVPKLSLENNTEKKVKLTNNDTLPEKSVLDRNAYFQNNFRGNENYFYSQMKYPIEALVADIQGQVRVVFTVDESGSVHDAKIVEGLGYGIDEEALRVVQHMPKWHPAIRNGKPTAMRITMGIDFYPGLAGGRRKSEIEMRREYYDRAPKIAPQNSPFLTISEIGKHLNKSLDFSEDSIPKVKFNNHPRLGFMMASLFNVPPITISEDSVETKR